MVIPCLCSFAVPRIFSRNLLQTKTYPNPFGFEYELYGGRYRTRTCDLLHVKQMLYQLS